MSRQPPKLTVSEAHARYQMIRPRLPQISTETPAHKQTRQAAGILETAEHYDAYLFDAFGVLNVGQTAIPGAAEALQALRARGKGICVLTNAASYPSAQGLQKYQSLGLDIRAGEVVSSRDALFAHLGTKAPTGRWSAICAEGDRFADAPLPVQDLLEGPEDWAQTEGFLFLSSARWNATHQQRLVQSLLDHPRPVLIGNPDLVAPQEHGLSIEPGYWAHDLQDRTGIKARFFGKPFGAAFDMALAKFPDQRVAMVGDTLHTDILGGQARGLETVLVTGFGLYAGQDLGPFIEDAQIFPSWQVPAI